MGKSSAPGMGSIYRRAPGGRRLPASSRAQGVYWLRWRDSAGEHHAPLRNPDGAPCRTLREAEAERRRLRAPCLTRDALSRANAARAEAERLARRLEGEELRASAPSLSGAWEEYVRHPRRRACGDGTLRNYSQQWGRMARWLVARRPAPLRLDDVTPRMGEDYAADLRDSGITATTYNRHVTFLRSFFALLAPGSRMFAGVPLLRVRTASRRALSPEELSRLLDACEGDLRALVLLGASTGLRLGDCCTLHWAEIDEGAMCIRRSTRKTSAEVGTPLVRQALDAMGERGDGYALPRLAELYLSGRRGRDRIGRELAGAFRRAGIQMHDPGEHPGRARAVVARSFHSLRHTWVSAMSAGGAPPALIQMVAGHSSPAMTEHYTHIGAEGLRGMADALARSLMPTDARRDALEREVVELARRADAETLERAREILSGAAEQAHDHRDDD